MSYALIETALLVVIRKHADFTTANAVANDYRILAKAPARAVIIRKDDALTKEETFGLLVRTWQIDVEVWVKYSGELSDVQAKLDTERAKVTGVIAQYPFLDDCAGVITAGVDYTVPPEPLKVENGAWVGQRVKIKVDETVDPDRQE